MKLNTIFLNPWFGVAGMLAGIFLSIYFYFQGQSHRVLSFYRYKNSAVVVKAGQASKMSVNFNGKVVSGDITAAQFAVWNSGNQSIRPENILEPIRVSSSGNVTILEARVRFISRSVTGFDLDVDEAEKGHLGFKWKILEPKDGAVIQIVFAGPPSTQFTVDGTVESQGRVRDYTSAVETPQEQRGIGVTAGFWLGIGMVIVGVAMPFLPVRKPKDNVQTNLRVNRVPLICMGSAVAVAGVFFLIAVSRLPPFEVPL